MRPPRCHTLVFVLLLAAAVGCDTVVQEEAEPPELIPAQAFTVQTALFQQSRSGTEKIGPHFMAAVMRAWPVATTLDAHLEAPVQLTRAALNEAPTVNREGGWVWSGTVSIEGQPVAFTLTGRPMGDQVDWTMEVAQPKQAHTQPAPEATPSASPSAPSTDPFAPQDTTASDAAVPPRQEASSEASPFGAVSAPDSVGADSTRPGASGARAADRSTAAGMTPDDASSALSRDIQLADSTFVLYTAQTDRKGQGGRWRLYDTVDGERTNVLTARFEIEKATKKEIILDVPTAAPEHAGDSVVYAHDEQQRRLRWTRARTGQTHRVTWNATSHEGSITATNYNDGRQACWGAQLDNSDCTSE